MHWPLYAFWWSPSFFLRLLLIRLYLAPGNQEDDVLFQSQESWIAEAIRCTHREAVEILFADGETKQPDLVGWLQFPSVERLSLQKNVSLGIWSNITFLTTPFRVLQPLATWSWAGVLPGLRRTRD
jgi:hypothetical protein